MKNIFVYCIISLVFFSCSSEVNCDEIKFIDGISYYNGKKFTGDCSSYFYLGNLKTQQSYFDGLDNDKWTFYFSNDSIRTIAFFDKGKRIGEWKYYAKNGNLWKKNTYDSIGNPVGFWKTYDTLQRNQLLKSESVEMIFGN